jgi:adenylate cyclase
MKIDLSKIKNLASNSLIRTFAYSSLIILTSLICYFENIPLVSNYLQDVENQTYDLLFLVRHNLNLNPKLPNNIVIVGIDATSIQKVGVPWPWPRQFHAALVDALHEAGAKAVFFDIIFDTISPLSLQTQDISGNQTSMSTVDAGKEDDNFFAASISNAMNVFLACEAEPLSNTKYYSAIPIDTYVNALGNDVSFLGNSAVSYDDDNFVRRTKLVHPEFYKDPAISSSIPLRIAQFYHGEKAVILNDGKIKLANKILPDNILINYYGPCGTIETIPYWKALEEVYSGNAKLFKNKIVLVGRSNLKASIDPFRSVRAPDSFATPFSKITPNFSGVEVQATITANILNGNYIVKLDRFLLLVLLIILGLFTTFIISRFRTKLFQAWYFTLSISFLYIVTSFLLLTFFNISIPPTYPVYGLILPLYVVNFFDQYFILDLNRRRQAKLFKQLVSPQVAEEIEKMGKEDLALGGKKHEITILFTDIQGFTSICEKIEPEVIVNILNKFLTAMVKIIHKHDGLVDKFIGDAIMALWGTPKHMDLAVQAESVVNCAIAMRRELIQINESWREMGYSEDLKIRIGINTGIAITGNLGSPQRAQFSAIGDAVNVASRLEGVNKVYGTGIIISEKTYSLLDKSKFSIREIDSVLVPGKDVPVRIFEVIDGDEYNEVIKIYSEALSNYRDKKFSEALNLWGKCLEIMPSDKASKVMLNRTKKIMESDELLDWKPVWSVDSK